MTAQHIKLGDRDAASVVAILGGAIGRPSATWALVVAGDGDGCRMVRCSARRGGHLSAEDAASAASVIALFRAFAAEVGTYADELQAELVRGAGEGPR